MRDPDFVFRFVRGFLGLTLLEMRLRGAFWTVMDLGVAFLGVFIELAIE